MDWTTPEGGYACISVCIHHVCVCVCVCMCTHLHANLGVCMPVCMPLCLLHECVIDEYIDVCMCTLCVCACVACVHVHTPSPSCRMSYCDPIYFLRESANTTNLYMHT